MKVIKFTDVNSSEEIDVYVVNVYDKWWVVYRNSSVEQPKFTMSFATEEEACIYLEAIDLVKVSETKEV